MGPVHRRGALIMSNATVALRVKLLFSVPSSLLSARKMEEGNQQGSLDGLQRAGLTSRELSAGGTGS
eukprot:scaffold98517_cov17-Tisochrysis_lutea.AAC.1